MKRYRVYWGAEKKKRKSWISTESRIKIEERRKLKKTIDGSRSERLKDKDKKEYREKEKEVKRSLRKDRKDWINSVANEAEDGGQQCQMKGIYEAVRRLWNEGPKKVGMDNTKGGEVKAR